MKQSDFNTTNEIVGDIAAGLIGGVIGFTTVMCWPVTIPAGVAAGTYAIYQRKYRSTPR